MHPIRQLTFPLGTWWGLSVRVHSVVAILLVGLTLRLLIEFPGKWAIGLGLMGIYVGALILHICAHALALLFWSVRPTLALVDPFGGQVSAPGSFAATAPPALRVWVAFAGPLYHLKMAILAAAVVWIFDLPEGGALAQLPWNPFRPPLLDSMPQEPLLGFLHGWFWVNWVLCLANLCLVGLPMDSGEMVAAWITPITGASDSTKTVARAGLWMAFLLLIASVADNSVVVLILALHVVERAWTTLWEESHQSETGDEKTGDEKAWQTEVETERESWWQKWVRERERKRLEGEILRQQADEARMDQLLEKIHTQGKSSLTNEELEFLRERADRYKNRMA